MKKYFATLLACLSINAYATDVQDPFEKYNRNVYNFNETLDKAFLKPVARVYKEGVPAPIQKASHNFFNNVYELRTVINSVLQAEFAHAMDATFRFGINSTVGALGIFDVATVWGIKPYSTDMGLTLAKWGIKNPPYLVIPLLGPSSTRDFCGMLLDYTILNPYAYWVPAEYSYPAGAYYFLITRAELLDAESLQQEALDPYIFQRDAYLQYRNSKMTAGSKD